MFRSVIGRDRVVRSSINFVVEEILLHELYDREWAKTPNAEAILDSESGRVFTYAEVMNEVKKLAAHLQKEGICEDLLVAFTATNSLRSCLTMLALIFCKCTIVIPKNSLTSFELGELLKDMSVKAAFGDSTSAVKFRKVQLENQNLKQVFCIDDVNYLGNSSADNYKAPPHSNPKNTLLFLTFTSGSTGPSKAVKASHFNFVANVYPFYESYWTPDMVQLLTSSVSHLSGIFTQFVPLAKADKIVVASDNLKTDLAKFADTIQRFKVTRCLAMPVVLSSLVNASDEVKRKLQGLRTVLTGGSITQEAIVTRMIESFPNVSYFGNVYGLSETFGLAAQSHNVYTKGLGLHVLPNMVVKVVDINSQETLPENCQGELWIQGPTVVSGYYNNSKATEAAFTNGWLRTGDLGFYDEMGRFFIVDRLKEMIKCLDSQIAPSDIEAVILRNPMVESVVVLGVPDSHYGEAPTAFVIPKSFVRNLTTLRDEIKAEIKEKCATHKQLYGGIFFVSELSKTDTGKFSRKDLLKEHLERKLSYLRL